MNVVLFKKSRHVFQGQKRKEQMYSKSFVSPLRERQFTSMEDRRLITERKVRLSLEKVLEF